MNHQNKLLNLSVLFFKLGFTAFGGPAAHIAMMQQEVVRRRNWLSEIEFLDLVSAANLIPGPNSTELAIHIGYRQAGLAGLAVAGLCFILPAALMVTAIAAVYVQLHQLPQLIAIMLGIKPVVLAIILHASIALAKSVLKTNLSRLACICALIGCFCALGEITILLLTGLLLMFVQTDKHIRQTRISALIIVPLAVIALLLMANDFGITLPWVVSQDTAAASYNLPALFCYFAKVGAVLYGSGYVLLAFLQKDLVNSMHWITTGQLMDATAIGQVTPGPVFTTATFIGYLLGGTSGALAATTGIFLPAFGFVAITAPYLSRLRQSILLGNMLDGVNAASLALMIYVFIQLIPGALQNVITGLIFALSLVILQLKPINATWLIALGALTGYLFFR
ncbi:MAG: chromate efflux transporter [Candidatus Obscuribacter sp.]|nr:chromate efflux transporter [Candidatus Obscuribacter sp.]MBK9618019.1 chromate efflux transporter [Candidatus Obscuribacter sp.]MBK9770247.1 chromate efflux transporter [Candidatus Obscuribacter sp.]MDQ5965531.1 Chromate efflux transporter [Cyanobacteriota bacterium erpe_2018_sw_39hr_WHONDRS-SW48-000098_B_bin.30]